MDLELNHKYENDAMLDLFLLEQADTLNTKLCFVRLSLKTC